MARLNLFGKSENKLRTVWQAAVPDHAIGVAWSPDAKFLAAAAVSGPVTVFDAATGKPAHELKGHGFGTAALAWQPTGNVLASVGQDGKVRLWDGVVGAELKALDAGAAWAEKVVWHPSGQWLATAAGKKARVWSATGELVRELPAQAGTVMDMAWRPGTNHLTLLAYGAATTYDPATGAEPVKMPATWKGSPRALSPDGSIRAHGNQDSVLAWKGSPLALAWSPDGAILAHGNQDATVHFWYYDQGNDLQMWGYRTKVRELAWDHTSRYLATGGGPVVCVWDTKAGPKGPEGSKPQMLQGQGRREPATAVLHVRDEAESTLTALAYQSRGFLLASAATDGQVFLWQPANTRDPQVGSFKFPQGEASVLAWSPDDRSLAAGSGAGAVAVFRAG